MSARAWLVCLAFVLVTGSVVAGCSPPQQDGGVQSDEATPSIQAPPGGETAPSEDATSGDEAPGEEVPEDILVSLKASGMRTTAHPSQMEASGCLPLPRQSSS